jgi:hypothetical protein
MADPKFWLIVASKNHVERGVQGGFMQAGHGKSAPLKRMKPGDWVVYYSPKLELGGDGKCQAFTAIGKVADGPIYECDMGNGFIPSRRDAESYACELTPIQPLIADLAFIQDKKNWGYVFRYGCFEIPESDFDLIASRMLVAERGNTDGSRAT